MKKLIKSIGTLAAKQAPVAEVKLSNEKMCKSCGRKERLYKHYLSEEIRCLACVSGFEMISGMWEEVE